MIRNRGSVKLFFSPPPRPERSEVAYPVGLMDSLKRPERETNTSVTRIRYRCLGNLVFMTLPPMRLYGAVLRNRAIFNFRPSKGKKVLRKTSKGEV